MIKNSKYYIYFLGNFSDYSLRGKGYQYLVLTASLLLVCFQTSAWKTAIDKKVTTKLMEVI